jgi:hypothetical protein
VLCRIHFFYILPILVVWRSNTSQIGAFATGKCHIRNSIMNLFYRVHKIQSFLGTVTREKLYHAYGITGEDNSGKHFLETK